MEQIGCGNIGLDRVCDSLGTVDSEKAQASNPNDEEKVKQMIRNSDGSFHAVNAKVRRFMLDWVGQSVIDHLNGIINARKAADGRNLLSL